MSHHIERINISEIKDPKFLLTMDYPSLRVLCEDIRAEIISKVSTYGGHLSPNLGTVELTVALHRVFDFSKDKLIFDVGHQSYTHKILTGRSLDHLNEPGHTQGFQKIKESIYDPYEAGHSSNSISAAEAFALARDAKKENYDVVAVIGDSSISNGLAFEGLNDLAARNTKVIVVLNDNGMSIGKSVGGFGKFFRKISTGRAYTSFKKGYRKALYKNAFGRKLYSFSYGLKQAMKRILVPINVFDNLGYTYIGPIDGHNIASVEKALKKAKNATKSVILHVHTTKGRGYPYAEHDNTGYWHGVTPFDPKTGAPLNVHPGLVSWSHYFSDLTCLKMKEHENAWLIVPATMKGSGLEKPFAFYKDRCLDVGIAEEHALTMAGALSLNGIHPIVSIYSTFLQRAYDELSHDCARLSANMTVLIERAGLVGSNGDTHQGIYDVAFLKSIPGIIVTMPSSKKIAHSLYNQSFKDKGIYCIRLPREMVIENEADNPEEIPFLKMRRQNLCKEKKIAVVAVGPMVGKISALIKSKGLQAEVYDPIYLNPISSDAVAPLLDYDKVLIYDAYGIKEGFADSLLVKLYEEGYKGKVLIRAIPNAFVGADSVSNQRAQFGLNPDQIAELIDAELRPAAKAKEAKKEN